MLMVYDLLLSKSGRITAKKSLAKEAVLRHKTRLKAELVKYKVKHKITDINALVTEKDETPVRWFRINTIRANVKEVEAALLAKFTLVDDWTKLVPGTIFRDENVKHLFGIHPSEAIAQMDFYKTGQIIIQDRASCFPATILSANFNQFHHTIPKLGQKIDSSVVKLIDACSAPGNKTTHLAALSGSKQTVKQTEMYRINAFERDTRRAQILKKMVATAGANNCVDVVTGDFTQSVPQEYPDVVGMIVDPSCSGSGIFGRGFIEADDDDDEDENDNDEGEGENGNGQKTNNETDRLLKLAGFQFKIVKHALSFPAAQRVVYSTCSIHAIENEHVVARLLLDPEVRAAGWRVTPRKTVLPKWPRRGIPAEFDERTRKALEQVDGTEGKKARQTVEEIAEGCVRALPKQDGGIGFFAVCFERDAPTLNATVVEKEQQPKGTKRGNDSATTGSVAQPQKKSKQKKQAVAKSEPKPEPEIEEDEDEDEEEWTGFD